MTTHTSKAPRWLTSEDASDILGVVPQTLHNMVARGELPGHKIGARWKFRPAEIKAYLDASRYDLRPGPDDDLRL